MEIRCRCHGLSGSCSLKTCWLLLPSFQTIGNYLKKKYELSVHLPTAIDLNKLIPMMDRNEITAILNNKQGSSGIPQSSISEIIQSSTILQQSHHYQQPIVASQMASGGGNTPINEHEHEQQVPSSLPYERSRMQLIPPTPVVAETGLAQPAPEYAALVASDPSATLVNGGSSLSSSSSSVITGQQQQQLTRPQISAHFIVVPTTQSPNVRQHNNNNLSTSQMNPSNHHNYYERHKQLQQQSSQLIPVISSHLNNNYNATIVLTTITPSGGSYPPNEQSTIEIPTNLNPMTQQQYQALIRDMRLCNTPVVNSSSVNFSNGNKQLMTRDLIGQQNELGINNNKYITTNHRTQIHTINKKHQSSVNTNTNNNNNSGHQLKLANQQLSQLLHPYDKDALIHLHKSPSYCEPDHRHGFAGIQSRICNKDKNAPDSCDKLCCGRGSRTLTYKNSYKCECKFQYCCSIFCNVCEQKIQLEVCN